MEILVVAIGVFGLVWDVFFLILAPKAASREEVVQRRLAAIAATSERASSRLLPLNTDEEESFWERTATFFLGAQELVETYTPVRRLLHQAGYPGERAVRIFWGIRIFLAITFAAGAFLLSAFSLVPLSNMLLLIAAGAGVGYVLPFLHVRRKAKFRTRDIQETFPDTLDLFVICVEAGLGLDGTLVRVAGEQADQGLAIGEEFQLVSREMQAGVSRREALTRLADRLDLEELRSLVVFLIQTEESGGSIARSLRIYAETLRQKRRQKAEEAARKMVIKLLFPLALFILPALFLVIFAPLAVNFMKFFASLPGR